MSDKRLRDKVCIVTGSTSGIGEAIAELFAEKGAKVVVSGRNESNGRKIADRITSAGHQAAFLRCDLADDAQIEALVDGTVARFGGIDVLVNNAAAVELSHGSSKDVASLPPDEWDAQIRVNLRAVYYLSHLAIPRIKERGGGTIVNVSSVGGMVAWPQGAAYLTSKGALNQLTRSMAVDYAQDHIRVNALCPGWILTAAERKRIDRDPEVVERTKARMGLQRLGEPREMAYAALFLACDESSYVTGTILVADGGWTLQ